MLQALRSSKFEHAGFKLQARVTFTTYVHVACAFALAGFTPTHFAFPLVATALNDRVGGRRQEVGGR